MRHMLFKRRRGRVLALVSALSLGLTGCGAASASAPSPSASGSATVPVKLVLNWVPTPESGGFFAASKQHFYEQAGLDVTIQPGGHHVSPLNLVTAGSAQFGIAQGMDQLLLAREHGLPVVALMLLYQTSPAAFMYRPALHIKSFADFNGHAVYYNFANVYWQYLVKRFNLTNVSTHSYTGNLAPFLSNPNAINQCFVTNEPFYVQQKGIPVKTIMLASSGYNPGADILFTTETYLKAHPAIVRKMVQATEKGWYYYYNHVPQMDRYLLTLNKLLNVPGMTYEAVHQKPLMLGGEVATRGFGYMRPSQWQNIERLMVQYGILSKPVNVNAAYTDQFISAP